MFASISVIALISRLVRPRFNTPTVLQVILPLAFILCTVHMLVDTRAIGFIVCPVAIINIAVHMDKFTLTMCSILTPLTSVNSTVRPNLFTKPVAESTSPLAIIAGSRSKYVLWSIFTGGIRIVNPLSHSLTGLLLREVLTGAELFGAKHSNVTSGDRATPPSLDLNDDAHALPQVLIIVVISCSHFSAFLLLGPIGLSINSHGLFLYDFLRCGVVLLNSIVLVL